jgi:NitT/TauT family transport system ATP-binding protein
MVALALRDAAADPGFGAELEVRDVDHGFVLHGAYLPVLSEVSFRARAGEFVALLGPSGCGKSTLLRLVAGLDRPRQGSLRVDGAEVTGPDPSRVVVFQDPTLYPWRTVWRNASLGLETRGLLKQQRHRVDEALALVGLEPFAKAFPHQLSAAWRSAPRWRGRWSTTRAC